VLTDAASSCSRSPADVPVDGRWVFVRLRVRRLRCPVPGRRVQTFREQGGLGIDDFVLRKASSNATILINAKTGRTVDALKGRTADLVADWLRPHPGAEVVTRPADAGSRRAGLLARRGPRADHARARPVPGRVSAVRLPAR
jgi:transposase